MSLVGVNGPRCVVNRLSPYLLRANLYHQTRNINTKPRQERPQPVIELIELRRQPNPEAKSIGILGGGITGLTTAWHLSRLVPDAQITLYEKKDRLGGWLDSETVAVDGGEVLFEWGLRSMRPDPAGSGRAMIQLLLQLDLASEVIALTKSSPAALNRFVYYGGRLVKMPGPNPALPTMVNLVRNAYTLFTEPIFKGALSALAEPWVQPRPSSMTDESVGDFIQRRFGKAVADNVASAFFHGIYAGDLYKLSARTVLPGLWHMETRDPEGNGILGEMADIALRGHGLMSYKHGRYVDLLEAVADYEPNANPAFLADMHHDISVYTLARGVEYLVRQMREVMQEKANIRLVTNAEVSGLTFDTSKRSIAVTVDGSEEKTEHDYVVSTLSPGNMLKFMTNDAAAINETLGTKISQALNDSNKAVNVAVVNLYYSNPNLLSATHQGFGYLIPRSVDVEENPERALGVIFGSEIAGPRGAQAQTRIAHPGKEEQAQMEMMLSMQPDDTLTEEQKKLWNESIEKLRKNVEWISQQPDEIDVRLGQDTAPGTKLTVMLGGHWWDGWTEADLPSEEECIDMAQAVLARHLKIMETPAVAKARVNRNCIPQYTVGYRQRMATIHSGLMEKYQGRLKVAGAWWQGGVGANDCVLNAYLTAINIREGWDTETGLKEYTEPEKWLIGDRRTHTFTIDRGKGANSG